MLGFDIDSELTRDYPGHLALQDVSTISGYAMRGKVDLIVASPPCQQYSLWGMRMFHPNPAVPDKTLWESALRIAHEAEAPVIIENVRGAQYWWGRASYKSGPFYFWGNVPPIWPDVPVKRKNVVDDIKNGSRRKLKVNAAFSSSSKERRELSAKAAMIPFPLAKYIGEVFWPASISRNDHAASA